jgi:hypothetical protein
VALALALALAWCGTKFVDSDGLEFSLSRPLSSSAIITKIQKHAKRPSTENRIFQPEAKTMANQTQNGFSKLLAASADKMHLCAILKCFLFFINSS